MAWTPAHPPEMSGSLRKQLPVTISMRTGGGRRAPSIQIGLRPEMLSCGAMLKPKLGVKVLVGTAENIGQIRIEPDGPFVVHLVGSRAPKAVVALRLSVPAGVKAELRKPTLVRFAQGKDWLEITLPDWALPAAPRRSIMDRVPDPAAPLRGPRA